MIDQGLMNNKHSELIPINASDQEQKAMIDQMKADSKLLWKVKGRQSTTDCCSFVDRYPEIGQM